MAFRQYYSGIEARDLSSGFRAKEVKPLGYLPKTWVNNSKLQIEMMTKVRSGLVYITLHTCGSNKWA